MLTRYMGLIDIRRQINPNVKNFTFFSHCHKIYSRIDLFLISTSLTDNAADCNIKAISLTDHAPVELFIKASLKTERRGRWRLNTGLLLDSTFKKTVEEDLKTFFEINTGSTKEITTVWEATKAYIRGKFIAQATKHKRKNCIRIKDLEKEIKDKELDLSKHFSNRKFQELCKLKYSLHEIYNKKSRICTS